MHKDSSSDTGRVTSRLIMVALAAALVIGLVLAGLLAVAAFPSSALFGTARTPALGSPASLLAGNVYKLYTRISWIAGIVFVLVQGAILYAALGFRRRSDDDPEPPQTHGNNTLELLWTVIPSMIVLGLAFLSFREMRAEYVTDVPDTLVVKATGFRWYWALEYADKNLGQASQPLTFTTATEMVIPVGRPVKVLMDSQDVIHAFWVPQLSGKRDAVPGDRDGGYGANFVWFQADKVGRYEGQCAELCGTWHSGMRFSVIAVEEAMYDTWAKAMAEHPKAPTDPTSPAGQAFAYAKGLCATCHMIDVVDANGTLIPETQTAAARQSAPDVVHSEMGGTRGPNLTRVASRSTFAGGMFEMNDDNLRRWLTHADVMKPGTRMNIPAQDPAMVENLMAFLKSLALAPSVIDPIHAVGPHGVPNDLDGLGGAADEAADENGGGDEHDAKAPALDTHLESTR
ncbi:MAG: cytochrome c oxidase subunit II [Ardenticatenales bacterium]